jgi:hypothetical protein
MRPLRVGGAWRRKRHGAPNREPPEIRSAQNAEPLCPVRGDDLPAGVVRISGPAPRPASVGMRSVRLQVRDPGHVPRPIVSHLPRVCDTKRHQAKSHRPCPVALLWEALGVALLWELRATPISRAEIAPQPQPPLPPMAAAFTRSQPLAAIRARAKAREPAAPPSPPSPDARPPATAGRSHADPRTGA